MKACGKCEHVLATKRQNIPKSSEVLNYIIEYHCRRYPPTHKGFPFVERFSYCGEFVSKEKPKNATLDNGEFTKCVSCNSSNISTYIFDSKIKACKIKQSRCNDCNRLLHESIVS